MSPLALVRLSTEFSHHICIGPSPKKKVQNIVFKIFQIYSKWKKSLTHCLEFLGDCRTLATSFDGGRSWPIDLKVNFPLRFQTSLLRLMVTVLVIEKGATKIWSFTIVDQPWQRGW